MKNPLFSELVNKFDIDLVVDEIKAFGNGHINDTYLVKTLPDAAPNYILQRKNHKIFKNVAGMMDNIVIATSHIRNQLIAAGETEVDRKVMPIILRKMGRCS